jgi:teichuronic acid biosynthesis glycosyltransferase TuaH
MIPSDITFVILGLQPWNLSIGSNCKDIALEISKTHRVLYVNAPIDVNTLIKNCYKPSFLKKVAQNYIKKYRLRKVEQNIWVLNPKNITLSISALPDGKLYDVLSDINSYLFSKNIRKALNTLGAKTFIIFNDSDMIKGIYLKEHLHPFLHLYYSRDNLKEVPYFKKHGKRLEQKLIKKSDICFANSTFLNSYLLEHNPNSYCIGQGCDFSKMVINGTKPKEFNNIDKPIIGYVGAINHTRLDIDLLEELCSSAKDMHFMFVGPQDEVFKQSKLHRFDNVSFTGPKKEDQLANYIAHFDVCINPQKINALTIGNYHRKIDEYLYMGKPTVATKTPAMEMFKEHVYLAEGVEGYKANIAKALQENTEQKSADRKAFAKQHTWDNSVGLMYKQIEKCLSERV